jgi:hypothetical protein
VILYLDTSALVKLYVREEASGDVRAHVTRAVAVSTSQVAYPEARGRDVGGREGRVVALAERVELLLVGKRAAVASNNVRRAEQVIVEKAARDRAAQLGTVDLSDLPATGVDEVLVNDGSRR